MIGGIKQRRENKRAEESNRQLQATTQSLIDQYNRAKAACLEGRGYTIK